MSRVSDILARKSKDVLMIDRKATVFEAIEKMVAANVGSILVTEGDAICGIFTERDYLRRIALERRRSIDTRIEDAMTSRLVCADPQRSVEDCMSLMTSQRIRHLPIMEGSKLVGIVSIGDLVKHLSREHAAQVRYLTDYVTGKYPA